MTERLSLRELRAMLQPRIREILARLAPGGHYTAKTYTVKNPARKDRSAGSFVIWIRGSAAGAYRDYAGHSSDDKGDIIDLISYLQNRGKDKKFARAWAEDFLGLKRMAPDELAAARRAASQANERRISAEAEAQRRKRRRAFDLWMRAQRDLAGTLAEAYFAGRGVPLAEIAGFEHGEVRFVRALEYWKGAEWRTVNGRLEKARPGPEFPAIVSAIRSPKGEVTAVHCTFLDPQTARKAPVARPKLMLGDVQCGVIRVARGSSGLTAEEAAAAGVAGPLVITEGLEDALSIALAVPEARVWAATSLGNLANVPVDHACVESVTIAADNDWAKPQAVEQLARAEEALAAHGKPVTVMRAHHGKDFNDLIRGDQDDE